MIPAGAAPDDLHAALSLSASVVLWRTLWGSMSARSLSSCAFVTAFKPRYLILLAVRAALTLLAQMTFIVVVTAPHAVTVWPILNAVPFLAILLSAVWIKERPSRVQGAVIGSVAAASLVQYVLL